MRYPTTIVYIIIFVDMNVIKTEPHMCWNTCRVIALVFFSAEWVTTCDLSVTRGHIIPHHHSPEKELVQVFQHVWGSVYVHNIHFVYIIWALNLNTVKYTLTIQVHLEPCGNVLLRTYAWWPLEISIILGPHSEIINYIYIILNSLWSEYNHSSTK